MRKMIAAACIAAIMLAVATLPYCAFADGETATTMYVLVTEDSCLRVHEKPSMGSEVTIRLTRGDTVKVYTISKNGWANISRAGDPGYCRVEFLTEAPPTEPIACTATVGKLNVRVLPYKSADRVRKLQKGDQVSVIGTLTGSDGTEWANIGDGFVLKKYLEESNEDQ